MSQVQFIHFSIHPERKRHRCIRVLRSHPTWVIYESPHDRYGARGMTINSPADDPRFLFPMGRESFLCNLGPKGKEVFICPWGHRLCCFHASPQDKSETSFFLRAYMDLDLIGPDTPRLFETISYTPPLAFIIHCFFLGRNYGWHHDEEKFVLKLRNENIPER